MPERPEIREEFSRLISGRNPIDRVNAFECITNAGFKIISDFRNKKFRNQIEHDADMLFQMTILKCLGVLRLFDGYNYINSFDGTKFNHTIDPFAIWPVIRSQYEAYCAFNNLFILHSGESQNIIYNLWVLSGLNYRQGFSVAETENVSKKATELIQIEELKEEINKTTLYQSLTTKEQDKIGRAIKDKSWQYVYNNGRFEFVSWKNMAKNAGIQEIFFDSSYSYLSLCTHPTNVSVFQFREMYVDGEHYSTSLFAINKSEMLIAFLIRDYCKLFPEALKIFNNLPEIAQLLVNSFNRVFRSPEFVLNNIEEHV